MKDIDEVWPTDELARNARGGTEMARAALFYRLSESERESVQIICSRVRTVDSSRPAILWLHDLAEDPENEHLADPMLRQRFAKLVFVSYWQFTTFRARYGIRYDESVIIPHGIMPFPRVPHANFEAGETIRLIYHTTPHRGLELLVPVVEHLATDPAVPKFHLDVYSSFNAYGWPQRDAPYKELFERIEASPLMTYHGFRPNLEVRHALSRSHIFAYPSIWQETACIAAIEAMAAGCAVVAPNYGALPETLAQFGLMYHWDEDPMRHAAVFAEMLSRTMVNLASFDDRLRNQRAFVNTSFSWDRRIPRWRQLIAEVTHAV